MEAMSVSHRYAQARLGFRQAWRWICLEVKNDDDDLTPEETEEYNDLWDALWIGQWSGDDSLAIGEIYRSFATQLLGCRTKLPAWTQTAILTYEDMDRHIKTYHEAAVGVLIRYIVDFVTPKNWRQEPYPIYVADTGVHGTGAPSPEGYDVWLMAHVDVLGHMSELWPWNPKALIA
jgi:hypothetical protein